MIVALLKLFRSRIFRAGIIEIGTGIILGVFAVLSKRKKDEIRKQFLLRMRKGTPDSRGNGQKEKVSDDNERNEVDKERQRSYTRTCLRRRYNKSSKNS